MRRNRIRNLMLGTAIASTALYAGLGAQQAAAPAGARPTPALYNTVKQKLRDGRQVVGATVLIIQTPTAPSPTPGSISPGSRCSTVP